MKIDTQDLTLKTVLELRTKLESLITNVLNEYEEKTQCKIEGLEIDRFENHFNRGNTVRRVKVEIRLEKVEKGWRMCPEETMNMLG